MFLFVQKRSLAPTSLASIVLQEKWKSGLGGNPLYGLGAKLIQMVHVKEMGVRLLEEFLITLTGIGLVALQ